MIIVAKKLEIGAVQRAVAVASSVRYRDDNTARRSSLHARVDLNAAGRRSAKADFAWVHDVAAITALTGCVVLVIVGLCAEL